MLTIYTLFNNLSRLFISFVITIYKGTIYAIVHPKKFKQYYDSVKEKIISFNVVLIKNLIIFFLHSSYIVFNQSVLLLLDYLRVWLFVLV